MSKSAIRLFSPTSRALFSQEISALEIKGREDARKIGPFFNPERELMTWVNWGKRRNGRKVRPYFRRYSSGAKSARFFKKMLEEEQKEINRVKQDNLHKKTQILLTNILNKFLLQKKQIPWAFKDLRLTDFTLSGDLLSGVTSVDTEFRIYPPFTNYYSLDIALLGNRIQNKPMLLGAIEIEHTNEVDLLKTLLCKSLGFPLFTIDISDVSSEDIEDITEAWCLDRLTETTHSSEDNRRRNYIYLHNMLYPVYLSNFEDWGLGEKHQYIIFATHEDFDRLKKEIKLLKKSLFLSDDDVRVMPFQKRADVAHSVKTIQNEGSLTGDLWESYNPNQFIRLILKRPSKKRGNIYEFHLLLTQLLTLDFDCLVGYKCENGASNHEKDDPIWEITKVIKTTNNPPNFTQIKKRFCPKRLSEPIREIMKYLPKNA